MLAVKAVTLQFLNALSTESEFKGFRRGDQKIHDPKTSDRETRDPKTSDPETRDPKTSDPKEARVREARV